MPDTGHGLVYSLILELGLKYSACVLVAPVRMENRFCIRIFFDCFVISIEYKLIIVCRFRPGRLVFLFLSADNGTDTKFLHDPVNPVFNVAGVVEMVDPARHPPVSQDLPEPLIILLYQFCQLYVLGFLFCNRPVQPFVVNC